MNSTTATFSHNPSWSLSLRSPFLKTTTTSLSPKNPSSRLPWLSIGRSTLSAEDLRRISETAETISVDLEASSDEDLEEETKLVDKIIEESPAARERSEGVIRDMYATVNPGTGAVASEEILDVLLSEARRIQWDRASQEGVSGPEPQQARSSPKRGAPVAQGDAAAKQAGRNLLREVYKQAAVGQDGGVDPDAALSIVLNEALRLIENRKRSQPKPDHELAALKKVKSKL
ncbi:hypothetical protein DFJ73DRAFT_70269 [Zopfochytrium polystomum]|nr:hypothetical protein DFJ73DRAFT_70269 [Zopfochytrium polystomum]